MRALRALPLLLLAAGTASAAARPGATDRNAAGPAVVTSAAPAKVAVTVYRNPWRGKAGINLAYLGGFALVTETRTVRLPAGPATIRFEGVAEGIVPVSAIVEGLPGGTVEKNRDARLLSPAALVDGTLGRVVTITRTDRASGKRVSEQATLIAGPTPGVVLKTAAGIETLRCSGLAENLSYAAVPAGLSAKPVLSVATVTPGARTATVTLSYIAGGFDWSASYVATLAADGRALDLFAWMTLANGNPESFAMAEVAAVAGRLNRAGTDALMRQAAALSLTCYPLGTTTSNLPRQDRDRFDGMGDIVVTAARRSEAPPMMMMAPAPAPPPPPPPPEDLGDLKLYRVPERVTVAPRAQKQVALLARAGVPFERVYRLALRPGQMLNGAPTAIALRLRNRKEDGLGLALPSGSTALYADSGGARLLLGTGTLADTAEGQTLRLAAGSSTQVRVDQSRAGPDAPFVIAVANANAFPVKAEIRIGAAGQAIAATPDPSRPDLSRIDGFMTWIADVPANGRATLSYTVPSR